MIIEIDNLKSQYRHILHHKKPVLLFGLGLIGKQVFSSLQKSQIPVQAILDNNINKQGTYYEGIAILSPNDFASCNIPVIIGIKGDYRPILRQLDSLKITEVIPYSLSLTWESNTLSEQAVQKLDLIHFSNAASQSKDYYTKLILHSIDAVITEKCSLRCRDCSNLMQYYERPQHSSFAQTVKSLDTLIQVTDFVDEVRILGGEPFVNPELTHYIKHILTYNNIGAIAIYTNGTIVPSDEQISILKNDRVYIIISDYGDVSRKAKEIAHILWNNNINAQLQITDKWQNCASLKSHERTTEENFKIFQSCCVRNMLTVKNGKLFRCPFASNAAALQAVPSELNQYVNLEDHDASIDCLTSSIKRMLDLKGLKVCDFCGGRSNEEYTIPAARQTRQPLPYTRFEGDFYE